jgi:hypothetical protein
LWRAPSVALAARIENKLGRDKAVQVGRNERLRGRERIFLIEAVIGAELRYLRPAPCDLFIVEVVKLGELAFFASFLETRLDRPAMANSNVFIAPPASDRRWLRCARRTCALCRMFRRSFDGVATKQPDHQSPISKGQAVQHPQWGQV